MITTLSQNEIERAMQLIREAEHRLHRGMNDLAHCHLLEAMDVLGLEKVGELEYDYS